MFLVFQKWILSLLIYTALLFSRRLTKRGLIVYLSLMRLVARDRAYKKSLKEAAEKIKNGAVWADEVLKLLKNLNRKYLRLVANLTVHAIIWGANKRKYVQKKIGFYPPTFLVISPTMRCNLSCVGCYANSYPKEELPKELVERVIKEANDLGIYFFVISGGEPFLYPIVEIARKYKDSVFHVFTNGTMLVANHYYFDERGEIKSLMELLLEVGNIIPLISIEGNENDTDSRRGRGVFKKIMKAMDELRQRGIPFGFSLTHTQRNDHVFRSDDFIDLMIEKGAYLGWVFQYIPIDEDPDLELIPTPEQRENRYYRIRKWRDEKPIVVWDFWNDGPLTNGCLAASRYLHITSSGDVEPCVFCHFSQDNIKEKSLLEILQSPFFKQLRNIQPYKDGDEDEANLLRPCIVIDHPEKLRKILQEDKTIRPTCEPSILKPAIVEYLENYKTQWKKIACRLWGS
ncbi:MAG: radical SAM protein [Candidatus Paceibacterota bacterium]